MGELRGFVAARHRQHGFILLQAFKKRKGIYYQLPGGRVDESEVAAHGPDDGCRIAAARELFEETGIDVRQQLHRLRLYDVCKAPPYMDTLNQRMYYELEVTESDVAQSNDRVRPITMEDFGLCLSREHRAWMFEKDVEKAAVAVALHSSGYSANALRMGAQAW